MKLADASLKPCPRCGAGAAVTFYPYRDYWVAQCVKCPTSTLGEDTEAKAISKWNGGK